MGSSQGFDRLKPPREKCHPHLRSDAVAQPRGFCRRTSFATLAKALCARCIC